MSWLAKLKSGLAKTSSKLTQSIGSIITKRKLDDETLEQLEEALIEADMGVQVAAQLIAQLRKERFGKEVDEAEVRAFLAERIAQILAPVAKPLAIDAAHRPHVMLVVGVNGNGKTTTIGKLAARFKAEGKSVMLAAADTFRAAAVEQLQTWGARNEVPVWAADPGADPASVAFRALEAAKAQHVDILMIDTAGRLHNNANLMEELKKIVNVIKKLDVSAPHSVLQVLDATTGQNALSQVEIFQKMINLNCLVVTKLDGTAKGGVVVALAQTFGLPIVAVGVGEAIEDLREFSPEAFSSQLLGLNQG